MGWTGDFESQKQAFRHATDCLKPHLKGHFITAYSLQDLIMKDRKTGERTLVIISYEKLSPQRWIYRMEDHTVGPNPESPVDGRAWKDFLSNPFRKDGEFVKPFIEREKKRQPGHKARLLAAKNNLILHN